MSLSNTKIIFLLIVTFIPLVILFGFVSPIAQNQAYHNFADGHKLLGIINFHNVISNIPFVIVAFIGLKQYITHKQRYSFSWLVFVIGVFLVGPGSAYYHLNPTDQTLVWDRLPMTIGFMGLTSFIFTEVFSIKKEKTFLTILLLIGFYSIFHWVQFSDLRLYFWVQLTPILCILYIAVIMPTKSLKPKHLAFAVVFYIVAKLTEHFDKQIFTNLAYSGHSIKHLAAAISVYALIIMKNFKNV
ncbi:MAG: hypothetical protein HON90_11350 [Halobacteriovoraceae bacterium]|jgi:hypothetical protein|nr:hypothetical protein [Halobacteriovoraceae bacterium]